MMTPPEFSRRQEITDTETKHDRRTMDYRRLLFSNPLLEFLWYEEENIYCITDGMPFYD
jgi:hypothetical protein